ncbi:putative DNA-binding transcriptional regulator AlpA [Paraburkholderia atlantica]|uniref:hypothetical protein n=1 Tax=Paraburkholderia atlantica TaxID=2654982 RepID=UPI003D215E99
MKPTIATPAAPSLSALLLAVHDAIGSKAEASHGPQPRTLSESDEIAVRELLDRYLARAPPSGIENGALSVPAFCAAYDITKPTFYKLAAQGLAPEILKIGRRTLITHRSAAEWELRMTGRRRNAETEIP